MEPWSVGHSTPFVDNQISMEHDALEVLKGPQLRQGPVVCEELFQFAMHHRGTERRSSTLGGTHV